MKTLITTGTVAQNRKARFNYTVLETVEAGIMLTGGEVKSLRAGHASIGESYASFEKGELFLINASILPYAGSKGGFVQQHDNRPRKLLLTKKEMKKLMGLIERKGNTLIPLELYFNARGLAKVKLALAVGKTHADKRETIKKRDWDKQKQRILSFKNK